MTALKSQGVLLKLGDGGTPTEVFTTIGEVVSVNMSGSSANQIDVTNLASSAKAYLTGLKDEGEVSVGLNLDTGDAQQTALRTAFANGTSKNFECHLTDSGPTVISFTANVTSFNIGITVDDKITLEITLKKTGADTWA